jgi:hypothetical protein
MDEDILAHTKECLKCQATKANKFQKTTLLQPLPQCSLPNQRIHMDLFGPCKTSDMGNKYILTITDAFTKYSEIVALPNKEAETVAGGAHKMDLQIWLSFYHSHNGGK